MYIHICRVCTLMYRSICDCEHVYVYMPACVLTISLCMNTCVLRVPSDMSIYIHECRAMHVCVCVVCGPFKQQDRGLIRPQAP